MSRQIQKVALAGASGRLGPAILTAFIAAKFEVTVLTRESSTTTFPSNVCVVKVDYDSVESLTEALRGQDAFVSTVSGEGIDNQTKQVDAAVAAGVARFIPSEYGCDITLEKCAALPMFHDKIRVEKYCEEKCRDTGTTYTFVYTNGFLDWGMGAGLYIDLKNKKINLYDGGDVEVTATPTDFAGRGTVAILQNLEKTANRAVRLQGAVITQNQLLETGKKLLGADGWGVSHADTAALEKQAYANLEKDPGNVMAWLFPMVIRANFGEGYSRNFNGDNDNEILGLKQLSAEEVGGYVKRAIALV